MSGRVGHGWMDEWVDGRTEVGHAQMFMIMPFFMAF
jgi:hypothetical protein